MVNNPDYFIYTDGSCIGNGKTNAKAGIGIYFGENDKRNTSRTFEGKQSNNTAELTAIIEAYKIAENDILAGKKIIFVTDSEYSIKCLTTYGKKQEATNWTEDIPNKVLVKYAYNLFKNKKNIGLKHIYSHTDSSDVHSVGNDNADKLANMAIGNNTQDKKSKTKHKIYLDVPFAEKDTAKSLGAKWNIKNKKWYIGSDSKNKNKLLDLFNEVTNL